MEPITITSELEVWPGAFVLPNPNAFSGEQWRVWTEIYNDGKRAEYVYSQRLAYAGLEFVKREGEWNMEIPLDEVQSWEDDPAAERIRLVNWLGKQFALYIGDLVDPKG